MARSFSNLSNSFSGNLELRVERLERTCNGLEARLINLTTLIRAQISNQGGEEFRAGIEKRLERVEGISESPVFRIEIIEKRLEKLEKNFASDEMKKMIEETQEKVKSCMKELKLGLKEKEVEFCRKVKDEVSMIKGSFKRDCEEIKGKEVKRQGGDEIDVIIKELQERIRNKTPARSESFSGIKEKASTPRSIERKPKKKSKHASKAKP
jgi:hypothetical protein